MAQKTLLQLSRLSLSFPLRRCHFLLTEARTGTRIKPTVSEMQISTEPMLGNLLRTITWMPVSSLFRNCSMAPRWTSVWEVLDSIATICGKSHLCCTLSVRRALCNWVR